MTSERDKASENPYEASRTPVVRAADQQDVPQGIPAWLWVFGIFGVCGIAVSALYVALIIRGILALNAY